MTCVGLLRCIRYNLSKCFDNFRVKNITNIVAWQQVSTEKDCQEPTALRFPRKKVSMPKSWTLSTNQLISLQTLTCNPVEIQNCIYCKCPCCRPCCPFASYRERLNLLHIYTHIRYSACFDTKWPKEAER